MDSEQTDPELNPIVALAQRIRSRRDVDAAIDSGTPAGVPAEGEDAAKALEAFAQALQLGSKRLNAILGKNGVTFIRLERPLRIRLRFRDKRVALDLDEKRQLVIVEGAGLDGDYQFASDSSALALINLSKLSTDAGYGEPLTPSLLLKTIAQDAELPRPAHLDGTGPLQL